MNIQDLKQKIRAILLQKYGTEPVPQTGQHVEFQEFIDFPGLKDIVIDLLTENYDSFIESIDWVAPKPTMFRINLKNGYFFYLTYTQRTWIATIEGKKYYLLNTPELQRALQALSRLLMYRTSPETEGDTEGGELGGEESGEDALDALAGGGEEPEEEL